MKDPVDQIPQLVCKLYAIVGQLEAQFSGRKFTLDGHLVGSIGEVLAADRYDLNLLPASAKTHDARAQDGRLVQIKATQVRSVSLRSEPEHLIVLRLDSTGGAEEIFNGPGHLAWRHAGRLQKNGQCSISVSKLTELMAGVPADARLQTVSGGPC